MRHHPQQMGGVRMNNDDWRDDLAQYHERQAVIRRIDQHRKRMEEKKEQDQTIVQEKSKWEIS